jgi:hypothetical protein
MKLFSFLGLLATARTSFQVAILTYVGAAGLAGVTIVAGLMIAPAREVVQEAVQPAYELARSVGLPRTLAVGPLEARLPVVIALAPRILYSPSPTRGASDSANQYALER